MVYLHRQSIRIIFFYLIFSILLINATYLPFSSGGGRLLISRPMHGSWSSVEALSERSQSVSRWMAAW